jgi:hypothetical protein
MPLSIGTLFKCRPIENLYDFSRGLYRTASTYQYGECLETQPDPETLYVMCKDGSVQSISDPGRPIGDRLTQTGFESKKCEIEIVGHAPEGRGFIGPQVHYVTTSQNAQITDGDDDEDEVTSSISFYLKD